jgi:hypothetical protein
MRNEMAAPSERLDAAKAAAPYVHPRLASIDNTHRGKINLSLSERLAAR